MTLYFVTSIISFLLLNILFDTQTSLIVLLSFIIGRYVINPYLKKNNNKKAFHIVVVIIMLTLIANLIVKIGHL